MLNEPGHAALIAGGEDHIRRGPNLWITVGGGKGEGGDRQHGDVIEPVAHAVDILRPDPQVTATHSTDRPLLAPRAVTSSR